MIRVSLILTKVMLLLSLIFGSCQTGSISEIVSGEDQISIGVTKTIHSKILDEDREIMIHVPDGFYGMNESDVQYSVLYVVDAINMFLPTVAISNQLSAPFTANDQAPPMIVVGIHSTNRNMDLTPTPAAIGNDTSAIHNTGGANKLAEFISQELIPYIDDNYPTTNHRILIGHSFGGLFVMNTLINYPSLFSNYMSLDPHMSWDEGKYATEALNHFSNHSFDDKKLFIATANNGMPWMTKEDMLTDTTEMMESMKSLLAFNNSLALINPKGLDIKEKYYESENHYTVVQPSILDGMKYFYASHSFTPMPEYFYPNSAQSKKDVITEIEAHFNAVSDDLGYEARPAESYLNAWGFGFLQFDMPKEAEALLDLNIKYYPSSAHVYTAKGVFLSSLEDSLGAIEMYKKAQQIEDSEYVRERIQELQSE